MNREANFVKFFISVILIVIGLLLGVIISSWFFNLSSHKSPSNFSGETSSTSSPVLTKTATLTLSSSDVFDAVVTRKISNPEQYETLPYGRSVSIELQVANKSAKDIKAVQGVIHVKNVFDEKILTSRVLFDSRIIYSNTQATFAFVYDINKFIDSDMVFYNTDFDYLVFDVVIYKVLFTDGTTMTFQ